MKIQGNKAYLKKDLSEENYPLLLKWLTDPEIIGYLYSAKRMVEFLTIEDIKEYLRDDPDESFWEIYTIDNNFIGYTSLCNFKKENQCEFSIFILDKNYWGKGVGSEASRLILDYAFKKLEMQTVVLETSELHQDAIRLYEKIGFKQLRILPTHRTVFHEGKWTLSGSVIMAVERNSFFRVNH